MTNRRRIVLTIASFGLALGLGYALRAAASGIPATAVLTYAGVLEGATGPVNGSQNVQVFFYDAATAGNILCQTTTAAIMVTEGHFSVPLPDPCTTAVGANPNVWVDVLVNGSDTGRTKIGAVPYAVEAKHASSADNASADGGIASSINGLQQSVTSLQAKLQPGPWFQVRNSTSSVAPGNTIVWNIVDIDTNAGFNTSTGLYTVSVAGTYQFYFDLILPNAPAGEYRYSLLRNGGVAHTTIAYKSTAGTWHSMYGSFLLDCAVGDKIGVQYSSGTGSNYTDPGFDVFYGHLLK